MPARNTIEIILTATDQASRTLSNVGTSMQAMGQRLGVAGALIENGMAPVRRGLESAIEAAMGFETSMVNAGSVLGRTKDEMSGLSAEVLALGTNSIFGGQQAADAYYDIVSGVQDASTHMAILRASMDLATAGNANLKTATNAVINVMNAYNLQADKAVYVTDALTKAVGMGKGTMDEFAAALPGVTAIAAKLGIEFHEIAAQAAFLTTKGFSPSEAATSLSASMVAFMKPNEDMKKALRELGVESGEAALKMWGLDGALERVGQTNTAQEKGMASLLGSVEALKGATYLVGEEFKGFRETFISTMDGATEAAKRIQMESLTMKWQLFQSKVEGLAIKIGSVFLPVLTDLADKLLPVLTQVGEWIAANPQLTQGILLVVGAMVIAGPIISALGSLISVLGGAIVIVNGALGLGATLMGVMSGATTILSGAMASASTFVAGLGISMMGAIAGILAVGAAIAGVISKVIEFNAIVGGAQGWAQTEFAALQAGGANISRDQVYDQAHLAVYNEFSFLGPFRGLAADALAPGFTQAVAGNTGLYGSTGNNQLQAWANARRHTGPTNLGPAYSTGDMQPGRASGGPVSAGQPYLVGEHGPELMVPGRSGFIVPNGALGGGNINVYVTAPEGSGRNAALGFGRAIALELRRRGA